MTVRVQVQSGTGLAEIVNVADPSLANSAATKNYVDTHSGVSGEITPERLQNFSEILPVADSQGYVSLFGVRNQTSGDTEFIEADLLFRVSTSGERQYFWGRTPNGHWRESTLFIPLDVQNNNVYKMLAITEENHFHQLNATTNYDRGGTPGTGIDVEDTDTFTVIEWFNFTTRLVENARIDSDHWATRTYVDANSGHQSFRGPWVATASYAAGDVVTYTFPSTETGTFANLSDQTRIYQASSAVAANSTRPPQNTLFREVGTDQTVELSDMPTRSQQTGSNGYYLQLDTTGSEPRYVLTNNVATDSELRINTTFLQSQIETNDTDIVNLRTYVDDHVLSVPVNKATGHQAPRQITTVQYNGTQVQVRVPTAYATAASTLATTLNNLRGSDNSSAVNFTVEAWTGTDFVRVSYEMICSSITYSSGFGVTDPSLIFTGTQIYRNGTQITGTQLGQDTRDGYWSDFSMYANNNHVATYATVSGFGDSDYEYFAIPSNGVLVYNDTDNTLEWQNLTTFIDSEAITQAELDTELRDQLSRLGLHYERTGEGDATLGVTYEFDQASAPVAGVAPVYNIHFNNASGGGRAAGDSELVTFTYPDLAGNLIVITTIVQDGFDGSNAPALLGSSIANNLVAHFTNPATRSQWVDVSSLVVNSQGNGVVITWDSEGVVNSGDITCGSSGVIGANPANPAPNIIYQRQIVTAGRANQPATYTIDNALTVDLPDWTSLIQIVKGYASDIDERTRHEVYSLPVDGNTGAVGPLHIQSWSYDDTELVLTLDSEAAVGNQGLEALFQNFYDNGFNLPAGNTIGDLDIGFKVIWFDTDTNAFVTDSVFVYPHHGNMVIDTENHTITFTPVSGQAVFLQVNGSTPSATRVTNGRGYLSNLDFENADNTPYLSVVELPDTVGEQYYHYSPVPRGQVLRTGSESGNVSWHIQSDLYSRLRNDTSFSQLYYSTDSELFPVRVDSEAQLVQQDLRVLSGDTDYYVSNFTYGTYVSANNDSEFQLDSIHYYNTQFSIPSDTNVAVTEIPVHVLASGQTGPFAANTGANSATYPYLNGINYKGVTIYASAVGQLILAPNASGTRTLYRVAALTGTPNSQTDPAVMNVEVINPVITATFTRSATGDFISKRIT